MMFAKVFTAMYEGSMMGAGADVFAVWPCILAHADIEGFVEINPRLYAVKLGMSPEAVTKVIEYLESPDPYSRSPLEEGRRIIRVGQFLYRIVNCKEYREAKNAETRREQNKEAARRYRAKASKDDEKQASPAVIPSSDDVSTNHQDNHESAPSAQVEVEVEVEEEVKRTVAGAKGSQKKLVLPFSSSRFSEVWSKFQAHRVEIRKSLKPTGAEALLAELGEHTEVDAISALMKSISSGWQGVFFEKSSKGNGKQLPPVGVNPGPAGPRHWWDTNAPPEMKRIGEMMSKREPVTDDEASALYKWQSGV